jgi:hypothetical protein
MLKRLTTRVISVTMVAMLALATAATDAKADHPGPLPDTINTPSFNYAVQYTNDNPYNPAAPGPNPDLNFFPDGQAQNLANAYSNANAAVPGTPNGYHNGYTDLGFLAPDFGGDRDTNVFDCMPHGGCDSGDAPADQIRFPAPGYITQPENCIRVVAGHELFHHAQYAYITFNNWQAWGGDPVEGTARLMQDKIFSDLDASGGCITYKGQVNGYLGNPNQTLWGLSYSTALFWNYLTEQLGTTTAEPQRGTDFVRRFWENAQTNNGSPDFVGTLRQTVGDFDNTATLENIFHDFSIANYAKNLDVSGLNDALRYSYRDENYTTGDTYNAVALSWSGSVPPQQGPQADSVVRWGSKYFEANLSGDCYGVAGFIADGDRAAYSLLAVNDSNKVDRVYKSVTTHFARSLLQRRDRPYARLVGIAAGLDDAANFDYTFACGSAKLDIIEPTQVKPAYVGDLGAPDRFLLRLNVTGPAALGEPSVEGLEPADFKVWVGAQGNPADEATVISGAYVQGQYWLVAQAPNKPGGSPDTYPLFVQLGDQASAAQQNAVIYQKLILDQVLVIDRSGSMLDPAGSPKIVAAKNAAGLFVDSARSLDKVGVVSFNGNNSEPNDDATLDAQLKDVTDPNRAAAKNAINALAASGWTSIGDGLLKGSNEFPVRGSALGEDWLVLMSDGMENEANYWNNVRAAIQGAGIRINAIALGPYTDQALLQQIANDTGGTYYYVDVGTGGAMSASPSSASAADALANRLGDAYAMSGEVMQNRERIWEDSGAVGAGASIVRTFTVGEGGIADGMFSFNWTDAGDKLGVVIQRPDGTTVQDGVSGAEVYEDATHVVARVGDVQAGVWTITLSGLAGAPQYIGFLSGVNQQGAQMSLHFAQNAGQDEFGLFMRGLPMPILVILTDRKGPVTGAKIYAAVEHPDGRSIQLPLLDDGNHGDGIAGDGLYGNKYTRTTVASPTGQPDDPSFTPVRGSYNVRVMAEGSDNLGEPFTRIRKGSFQMFEGPGRKEQQPDVDKDGMPTRYELLHPCLDPSVDDAGEDPDDDGIKNYDEWDQGFDPCNPDTDRGGEADLSEFQRAANVFDPQDDALPKPIDPEVIDYVLDHLPKPDLRPESNLIRYPVAAAYVKMRLWRSVGSGGPFGVVAEFDAKANAGLYRDEALTNGVEYCYKIAGVDLNGNAGAPSHVFCGTPKDDPFPPIGRVSIADGRPIVTSATVRLKLGVDDADVVEMMISNEPTLAGASWEPFDESKVWTLGASSGYAIVYARFRDASGNVSTTYYDDVTIKPLSSLGWIKGLLKLKLPSPLDAPTHAQDGLAGIMVSSPGHNDLPPAYADETGAFVMPDLPPGVYTLEIQHTGYAPALVTGVAVSANGETNIGEVELQWKGVHLPIVTR